MDKSSRFISLSGFSGIFVGIYALIGAGIAYFKFGYRDDLGFYNERTAHSFEPNKLFPFIIADATIVLILSLITAWYFTNRRAKKNNVKLFNKPGLKLISNLFIPLVTGGLFCLILLSQHLLFLIAPLYDLRTQTILLLKTIITNSLFYKIVYFTLNAFI